MGLHQRYARLLKTFPERSEAASAPAVPLFIAGRKEREDEIRKQLSLLFEGMMKAMYKTEGAQLSIDILSTPQVREFIDSHSSVLDSSFEKVDMSDAMRRKLQRSDWIFSGMKTFHELNEAFPSLIDENGDRKSFERFLNDVRSIDRTYNSNYLRAEYNFVSASAEMAAKWEGFMQDGDRYNLQYRTQKDDKVRPEHAALDGVTLPPSDPFWAEFYPPNGWNCRCTVVQVRKSKYPATPHEEAMRLGDEALQRDSKGIFRFNPGIEQSTVPAYNPYTIRRCRDCDIAKGKSQFARMTPPDNTACEACRWLHKCLLHDSKTKKGNKIPPADRDKVLAMPFEDQFTIEYNGAKGNVFQHILHCTANDDNKFVMEVAKAFADLDGDCWINPVIRDTTPGRTGYYYDLPSDSKCNPDLKTRGYGYVDVKSPREPHNWGRNAVHASDKQHSCACLTNHRASVSEEEILHRNKLIWKDPNYHHDHIFWFIDGILRKYKRP